MELGQIYSDYCKTPCEFTLGRTGCQAVDVGSQWMEPEAGGILDISNQSMNSKQFQRELQQINAKYHAPNLLLAYDLFSISWMSFC